MSDITNTSSPLLGGGNTFDKVVNSLDIKYSDSWQFIDSIKINRSELGVNFPDEIITTFESNYRKFIIHIDTDAAYSFVQFYWNHYNATMGATAPIYKNDGTISVNQYYLFEKLEGIGWRITQASNSDGNIFGYVGMKLNDVIQNNVDMNNQEKHIKKFKLHYIECNFINYSLYGVIDN